MSGDYLDASLILATLIDEVGSPAAAEFLQAAPGPLLVSEFAAAEVAAALSRLSRAGEMTQEDARRRLEEFDVWVASSAQTIDVEAADVRLAGRFVRRFDLMLRAPDAVHAAIAQRLSARLVTMDRRLAAAAKNLGVEARLISV